MVRTRKAKMALVGIGLAMGLAALRSHADEGDFEGESLQFVEVAGEVTLSQESLERILSNDFVAEGGEIKNKKNPNESIFLNCVLRQDAEPNSKCAYFEFVHITRAGRPDQKPEFEKFGSSLSISPEKSFEDLKREFSIKTKLERPRYFSSTKNSYSKIGPMVTTALSSNLPGAAATGAVLKWTGLVGMSLGGSVGLFALGGVLAPFLTPIVVDSVKFPFQWAPYAFKKRKIRRMNRALVDGLPYLLNPAEIGKTVEWKNNRFQRLIRSFRVIFPGS